MRGFIRGISNLQISAASWPQISVISMNKEKIKQNKRNRRHKRVRSKVRGTEKRPRLSVFRSNKGMYLQLIDDESGRTLVSAHTNEVKKKDKKTVIGFELGKLIAKKSLEKNIKQVVFDKSSYKYHGRVKAVADGAREGGLRF
jgi:large subunit ribosomal protein L18